MKTKTKQEIGRQLEQYVLNEIREIDFSARLSRGSGNSNDHSDITSQFYYIECKKRNTVDFTIKESIWLHLNNNLPIDTKKICFMVNENIHGKKLATLDLKDLIGLLKWKALAQIFEGNK